MANYQHSLEELSRLGVQIYCEMKEALEKNYMGQFVVIDVDEKKYVVDSDELTAIKKAKREFGDKLFCIIRVGSIQNPNINFSSPKYAWYL